MSRFVDTLRETSARLSIPQPARSRVLLEIAADMEDLFAIYRARGLSEDDARREAVDSFDLSDDALAQLARVHSGPVRRQLDRLSARNLLIWERILLLVIFVAAFQAGGWLGNGDRIFRDAGPFVWPVTLVAIGALVLAIGKFYQLFLKQDHESCRLQNGLGWILGLALLLAFLGLTGSSFEVLRLARGADAETASTIEIMLLWALHSTALLQLSLGLALLCALAWSGLAAKVARIEKQEANVLLNLS